MHDLISYTDTLELALRAITNRIQLSSTKYEQAVQRYNKIAELLESETSSLRAYQPFIYPQGSFRTQSVISSKDETDHYDIDLMLELNIQRGVAPERILSVLEECLRDLVGNTLTVKKKRRCVTLEYSDMHLDITPGVLIANLANSRPCEIYDRKPERPNHVVADPEGFARWFDKEILPTHTYGAVYESVEKRAEPVPDQKHISQKPTLLLVVQLLKRYRDMRCQSESYRKIPSVLLSRLVAEYIPTNDSSLLQTLKEVAAYLSGLMESPLRGIQNPSCSADVLTDRWPGDIQPGQYIANKQAKFKNDMDQLIKKLNDLQNNTQSAERPKVLSELFGERAATFGKQVIESATTAQKMGYKTDEDMLADIDMFGFKNFVEKFDSLSPTYEKKLHHIPRIMATVTIEAEVHPYIFHTGDFRPLNSGDYIIPRAAIKFTANIRKMNPSTKLPDGNKIIWQITNTGLSAAHDTQPRGDIIKDKGRIHWETTFYPGVHWVRAFLVKDNILLGSSKRFYVVIQELKQ